MITCMAMKKAFVSIFAAAMLLAPICGGSLAAAAPPGGGTISIEAKTSNGDYDPAMPSFVGAAADALAAKGFTILEDPGHSAYVVELVLSRVEVGTGTARVPTGGAVGVPGGAFGSVGAGVVIPLPTGRSSLVPLLRTRLEMRIRKRGEAGVVWHGAAVTVRAAGTRKGADAVVAAALSDTLLQFYPLERGDVVGVP
jgi:hypothetical protein